MIPCLLKTTQVLPVWVWAQMLHVWALTGLDFGAVLGLTAHRPICACLLCLNVVSIGFVWHFRQLILAKSRFHSPAIPDSLIFHLSRELSLLPSRKTWGSSSTSLHHRLFGGTYDGLPMQKIFQSHVKPPSAKFLHKWL